MSEPSLPDKIVAIDEQLDAARIRHAFGGALALAYYAEPRTTVDIDLNLFVGTNRFSDVQDAFAGLGVDELDDRAALDRDGQCRLWWGRTPLDLFFAYDPIHTAMKEQLRRVPFGDTEIPVLGPEHLIVCKAVFDRPKDWIDIEQALTGADQIERGEVDLWLSRLVGSDDERKLRFDRLADDLLGPQAG